MFFLTECLLTMFYFVLILDTNSLYNSFLSFTQSYRLFFLFRPLTNANVRNSRTCETIFLKVSLPLYHTLLKTPWSLIELPQKAINAVPTSPNYYKTNSIQFQEDPRPARPYSALRSKNSLRPALSPER